MTTWIDEWKCPTCEAGWALKSKTMGAANGQPHEVRCKNGHWWKESEDG